METIVLGGGCFWCTEAVFQSLQGVQEVVPGYSGGHLDNPSYEQVCNQTTGHIEVIRIRFDPQVISLEQLLRVFYATHDPTTKDRQGGDVGPQYASVVFYETEQQRAVAQQVTQEVEAHLGEPVVTQLRQSETFWPAESLHHNYYLRNPRQGYCAVVISPKLHSLRKNFSELLKSGEGT